MSEPLLDLSAVTLLCVETRDPALAHFAIQKCTDRARFSKVVLITDLAKLGNPEENQAGEQKSDQGPQRLNGIEYVEAPSIKTTKDYSHFLLTGLRQYVPSSHVLIIQWDSFIIHPELWTDDFLKYDYIGAIWPHHPEAPVGNGGFSLRSVKLLDALISPHVPKRHPEDFCICIDNRERLEKEFDIRFAPTAVAEKFAVERSTWHPAFGFHGLFNFAKVFNSAELPEFLHRLSDDYLSGVDAYDLIDDLMLRRRPVEAQMLRRRVQFSWKWRKRFIQTKVNMILAKYAGGHSQ
jgi:hypothetical protein